MGLIVAAVVLGPRLSSFFGDGQDATTLSGLEDNTSPEALIARRGKEETRLNTYGWVDKEAGVVRIPIERAMALVAESGLPVGDEGIEETTPEEELPTNTPAPEVDNETPVAGTPFAESLPTATPAPDGTGEAPGEEIATPEPLPTGPPTPTVDLANVSFQNHVLLILEQHCVQCHGGDKPEGGRRIEEGLILQTYEDVLAGSWNGPVIEPGNVEDSYLIEQITSGRMPKEGPLLSLAEIEIITAWVEAGAPDN